MEQQSEIMEHINELLPQFGITSGLKEFQKQCILRILADKKDVFCIKNTGLGKSICYQLPALLLPGVTVVLSPLISLIDDQIASLEQKNIPAAFLCSVRKLDKEKRKKLKEGLRSGQSNIKIIYTTPETLRYEKDFFSSLNISLLVIDEAHCVSILGQDFRPSYRCIRQFIDSFSPAKRPIIAAFTATADRIIFKETVKNLGLNVTEKDCIGTVKRKIAFDKKSDNRKVFLFNRKSNQINSVCSYLLKHADEKSLVFCRSKEQLNLIYDKLEKALKASGMDNFKIGKYYGGVDSDSAADAKKYVRALFANGEMRIVIATSAFGMGIDIEDIRNIIHVGFPFTMTDYVQQCGRGGRDGNGCECRLYASVSDVRNTAGMLKLKYLKMYPLQQGIKIKKKDRERFIEVVEYCLKSSKSKNEKLRALFIDELEKYKSSKFPEEYYTENKAFQMLINTSAEIKKKIRRKKITFYEAVLADGVYSLWYNGAESFTPRRLIACVTGNENLNFHKEKSVRAEGLIDGLIAKRLLPVVKKTVNGKSKYFFNEAAKECIPGAFPLQETALQKQQISSIPNGILAVMSDNEKSKSQKKRLDEYEQVTAVKYYLLHELNRIFRYSDYHDKLANMQTDKSEMYPLVYNDAAWTTSRKIIYLRYDRNAKANRNAEKRAGMLGLIEFPQSTEQLHKTVCAMLDNLIKAGYLRGYKAIYYSEKELKSARKMGWDLSESVPKGIVLLNNNQE